MDRKEHSEKRIASESDSKLAGKRFSHRAIVRAPGLLPMLYSPAELGLELGVSPRSIREWTRQGLPCVRDAGGRIWVDGRQCAAWVHELRKADSRGKLRPGEAWCLRCRKAVPLTIIEEMPQGKMVRFTGRCPECGGAIHRGGRIGQPQ